MNEPEKTNNSDLYARMSRAIEFIVAQKNEQPDLETVAANLHMSPFHFQRLFSQWVGLSPKRFLQVLTVEHAKQLLAESTGLLQMSEALGLSSSSRLYDHFVTLEAMTPGEYRSAGHQINIQYGFHYTPFGLAFIAITERGICHLAFIDANEKLSHLKAFKKQWFASQINQNQTSTEKFIQQIFHRKEETHQPLSLLVKGTNFQIQVWRALLQIPSQKLVSYAQLAQAIDNPKAIRAVGTAVGANPLAFLIPCHRVIRATGHIGGYRWGLTRKHAIHAWEIAQ
ncbi:MAG: methylated-DNA--[protein]-cysteine S-methyltransferase [Gammaproteobacteria bacterium]|nr:methylated-DNA--[protein]-cysteine S-methyltransferase [Gammaproteobacteria bacterium]MDH5629647.1 methylated-DNA--[protein]-cysteine S-methyltransferase [Gammaproteobacteria bacterium]